MVVEVRDCGRSSHRERACRYSRVMLRCRSKQECQRQGGGANFAKASPGDDCAFQMEVLKIQISRAQEGDRFLFVFTQIMRWTTIVEIPLDEVHDHNPPCPY